MKAYILVSALLIIMSTGIMLEDDAPPFTCTCEYRGVTEQDNVFTVNADEVTHKTINNENTYVVREVDGFDYYFRDESVDVIDFGETTVMYYISGRVVTFRDCIIVND